MKTFEERAMEWMKKVGWSSHTTQHGAVVLFARHLDQEAQEKCCVLCDGKDCGHLHHHEKPLYTAGLAGEISNCHAQNKPNQDKPSITYTKPQQPECAHYFETAMKRDTIACGKCGEERPASPQPQQPEEIEMLPVKVAPPYWDSHLSEMFNKINEVIRTLNRLTHKD